MRGPGPQSLARAVHGWAWRRYTFQMDRVRFGRVLGYGTRQAVKTLVGALDAATAESPPSKLPARTASAASRPTSPVDPNRPAPAARPVTKTAPASRSTTSLSQAGGGVRRGAKQFGAAVWNPFVRLSGVLWLECVGFFFGIFALFALGGVWKQYGAWHTGDAAARQHLVGAAAMAALFGYFCVSSFVKAHRRSRSRSR